MNKYDFKEKHKRNGELYYHIKINETEKKKLLRRLYRSGIKYSCVPEQWERSTDYRQKFFKENNPPYRCRYCNRILKKDYLVVDHIIPVHAAKTSQRARRILKLRGINSVNDPGNLTASCKRCNEKKGSKMGIWLIRAYLGRYKLYWILRPVIRITGIALLLWYLQKMGVIDIVIEITKKIISSIV